MQQLQMELETERQGTRAAQETVKRLQDDKEQLRSALNQLQESMKSKDTTGQIEEMVRQVRTAQDSTRGLEIKLGELEKVLEATRKENVASTARIKVWIATVDHLLATCFSLIKLHLSNKFKSMVSHPLSMP